MSDGPSHYQEAERLLAEQDPRLWPAAQVHATLALAAATIDAAERYHMDGNGHNSGKTVLLAPAGGNWADVLQ